MKMRRTGPDSVNSWFAALACALISMIIYAVVRVSGVMFVASMSRFNVDRKRASMPYILTDVIQAISCPLTGYLAHKYGVRVVMALGCLVSAIGTGACFFAEQIETVTIFWGVVFGIGFGLSCPLLPVIIAQHFVNNRAIATGVVYVAGYFGFCSFSGIVEFLIDCYGLSGTFLCISGLMLNSILPALLLRKPNFANNEPGTDAGKKRTPSKETHIRSSIISEPVASMEIDCELNHSCDSDSHQREIWRHEKDLMSTVNNGFELEGNTGIDSMCVNDKGPSKHSDNFTSKPIASKVIDCESHQNLIFNSDTVKEHFPNHGKYSKGRVNNGFELESDPEVDSINNKAISNALISNELFEYHTNRSVKKPSNLHPSLQPHITNKVPELKEEYLQRYKGVTDTLKTISDDAFSISCNTARKDKMATSWSPYTSRNSIAMIEGSRTEITPAKNSSSSFRGFQVFLDPVYIIVLVTEAIFEGSFIAFVTIIIDYARDIGLPLIDGKYIFVGLSVSSCVGLLSFGWVTDDGHMTLTNFSALLFVCRSITTVLIPFSNGLSVLLVVVVAQGLLEAPLSNLLPLIIADYFIEDVHEVAISCRLFLCAPVYLLIPYLIGYFRDDLGSYFYLFTLMSFSSLLCAVCLFLFPQLAKFRCGREQTILRNKSV